MRLTLPLALLLAASSAAAAQTPDPPKPAAPKAAPAKPAVPKPAAKPAAAAAPAATPLASDDEKTVYAVGLSIWRSLAQLDLSPAEVAIVQRAIADSASGAKTEVTLEEFGPKFEAFARARSQRTAEKEKARSQAYLEKAAAEPGATKTESGLIFIDVTPGTGASPSASDTVKVHYRGTLVDGTEFDSSYKRGEPAQFPLGGVIRCWTEGLQKIKVGGKAKLICPSDIAYGDRGRPSIPGGAALTFEVELIDIVKAEPPAAPATPAPADAPKE